MAQIRIREKHQITLPMSIVRAAGLHVDGTLTAEYRNGVIMLSVPGRVNVKKKSIMDYAGCLRGLYGHDATQVDAYLQEERQSWEM